MIYPFEHVTTLLRFIPFECRNAAPLTTQYTRYIRNATNDRTIDYSEYELNMWCV